VKRIVSFRTMPSCNLVYAVLSLGVHATSARIKVRPQSNLDGLHCLACLNAMHFISRLKLLLRETSHMTMMILRYLKAIDKQHLVWITSE
jgi:hypothetical protein